MTEMFVSFTKDKPPSILSLGKSIMFRTVQSLFHNVAGANRNGVTTFLSLYTTGSTLFIEQI